MKNRNTKIEQIICSAVSDFTRICELSYVESDGSYIAFLNGMKIITLRTKYEKEKFFVYIICHMENEISTFREVTLQQIFSNDELKEFLESINYSLIIDDNSDLQLVSSWEYPYKEYAILKSSIVFLLSDALRNMNYLFEILEARTKELEEAKLNCMSSKGLGQIGPKIKRRF